MPMYEYHCTTCNETIEVLLRHGEPEPRSCGDDCTRDFGPEMGQGALNRVDFSVTGGYVLGASRPAAKGKDDGSCGVCGSAQNSCS